MTKEKKVEDKNISDKKEPRRIAMEYKKGDSLYQLVMPEGTPPGELLDAVFAFLINTKKLILNAIENQLPKEVKDDESKKEDKKEDELSK